MSPACSWPWPRVAETVRASDWVKVSGNAPYFSELASVVADSWVKLPVISVFVLKLMFTSQ